MSVKHSTNWISALADKPENWQLHKTLFHPQASVPAVLIVEDVLKDSKGYFFNEATGKIIGEFPFKKLMEAKIKRTDLRDGIFIFKNAQSFMDAYNYKSVNKFLKTYKAKLCCPDNEYIISEQTQEKALVGEVKRRQAFVHNTDFKITPEFFKALKLGGNGSDILKLRLAQESLRPKFLIVNLNNVLPATSPLRDKLRMNVFSRMEGILGWVNQDGETVAWSKVKLPELNALYSPLGLVRNACLKGLKDKMGHANGKPKPNQLEAVERMLGETLIGPDALSL